MFNLQVIVFLFSLVLCPGRVLSLIVKCDGNGVLILFCFLWSPVPVVLCSCIVLSILFIIPYIF